LSRSNGGCWLGFNGAYYDSHKLFIAGGNAFAGVLGADWSGYDYLWIDVRTNATDLKIKIQLEDQEIEPFVTAEYAIPDSGAWYTLQFDLNAALSARGLDLQHLASIQITYTSPNTTSSFWRKVYADNFRLVTSGESAQFPILQSLMNFALPPLPAAVAPYVPDISPDLTTLTAVDTVYYEAPSVSDSISLAPCGFINAFDKNNIAIGFSRFYSQISALKWDKYTAGALFTRNGGQAWEGSHGINRHDTLAVIWPESGIGAVLENHASFMLSSYGCCGPYGTGPRQFIHKYNFKGSAGWVPDKLLTCIDADMRHCGPFGSFISLPSGRWWVALGNRARTWDTDIYPDKRFTVNAKYSDDQGASWHSWRVAQGKSSEIPGIGYGNTGGRTYARPIIVPFNNHVAVLFTGMLAFKGLWWTYFDGSTWSTPERINANATNGGGDQYCNYAIAADNGDIFATAQGVHGVMHYDKSAGTWTNELTSADQLGLLAKVGEGIALVTYGDVVPDGGASWAWLDYTGAINLYRWDWKTNTWGNAEDLSGGAIPLKACGRVPDVKVSTYCPANMLVVGWNTTVNKIKILKIPYDGGEPSTKAQESNVPGTANNAININVRITSTGNIVPFTLPTGNGISAKITVHDIRGKKIANAWQGVLKNGLEVNWRGTGTQGARIAAGCYVIKVSTSNRIFAKSFNIVH